MKLRENPEGAARYSIQPPDGITIGQGIRVRWNQENEIMVGELHYSADPGKCTEEWYKRERAANKLKWDREYELAWRVADGKGVYSDSFNPDIHVSKDLPYDPSLTLYAGWDFGRDPCCVFSQITKAGQVLDLGEVRAPDKMSISSFMPYYQSYVARRFVADNRQPVIRHAADPAGWDKGQQGEQTCVDVLRHNGIHPWKPWTNQMAGRLGAVEELLGSMAGKLPRYQIDSEECQHGTEGFLGGYCYKKIPGTEMWSDVPVKNAFSHPADARQYMCQLIKRVLQGREGPVKPKPDNWRKSFNKPRGESKKKITRKRGS